CPSLTPSVLLMLAFFLNDTAPPEIYTLSLHDALPICRNPRRPRRSRSRTPALQPPRPVRVRDRRSRHPRQPSRAGRRGPRWARRSEEHTSELQSRENLVCRLLLEKKK